MYILFLDPHTVLLIGPDSTVYHVVEGESVTATVGVMNYVILDRYVFVNVHALGGTATYGNKPLSALVACLNFTV